VSVQQAQRFVEFAALAVGLLCLASLVWPMFFGRDLVSSATLRVAIYGYLAISLSFLLYRRVKR